MELKTTADFLARFTENVRYYTGVIEHDQKAKDRVGKRRAVR
jgi:hypothetical protein